MLLLPRLLPVGRHRRRAHITAAPLHLAGRISFYRLNIKNESRFQGLIKMADVVGWLPDLLLLVDFYFVDFADDDSPLLTAAL